MTTPSYSQQDLRAIFYIAAERGIGHWALVTRAARTADYKYEEIDLIRDDDFDANKQNATIHTISLVDIAEGIRRIAVGDVKVNERIKRRVTSGDLAQIDAESADAIIQGILFGRVAFKRSRTARRHRGAMRDGASTCRPRS